MGKKLIFLALVAWTSLSAQALRVQVLGIAQDAGRPQIACEKDCCRKLPADFPGEAVSLAVLDFETESYFLVEASPGLSTQLRRVPENFSALPQAIFITHAHMGHYGGLMQLGREACNAQKIPVYGGARLVNYLRQNGPWSQLVALQNIIPTEIKPQQILRYNERLQVEALKVPHRDEYSETYAYLIQGPQKRLLFIPDIDKWEKWELSIDSLVQTVDYALLDATFFSGDELPGRDMSEIPHPFVRESMQHWSNWSKEEKGKVHFIHLNHSNPLWDENSEPYQEVLSAGFNIARVGQSFEL